MLAMTDLAGPADGHPPTKLSFEEFPLPISPAGQTDFPAATGKRQKNRINRRH